MLIAVAVAGCGSTRARRSSPTATTRPGTTSRAPSTASPAPSYAWARLTGRALDLGGGPSTTLSAVLAPPAPGGQWLVAGTRTGPGGPSATVWQSSDALTWQAATLPGADTRALAATRSGAETVVVGSEGPLASARAAVWVSHGAGLPFAAVPASAALEPTAEPAAAGPSVTGSAAMDVVGAGTTGIFAAGDVSGRIGMWYSSDGAAWSRLTGAEKVIDGAVAPRLRNLVVTPTGVVAVGTVRDGTADAGALWSSPDGIHWGTIDQGPGPWVGGGDHVLTGVAALGTSLVAVGGVRAGRSWAPASWVSPNGSAWTAPQEDLPQPAAAGAGSPVADGSGGAVARAVAAEGTTGVVAVGGSASAQRVWTSTDGRSWQELPLPPAAATGAWRADLVAGDATTTVVADGRAGQPHLLVHAPTGWTDVTATSTAFGAPQASATVTASTRYAGSEVVAIEVAAPPAAIGPTATSTTLVSSSDGSTWRRDATLRDATVRSLVATDGGLVAVGDRRATGAAPTSPAVWRSPDGATWRVVTGLSPPGAAAGAVAADATRVVVAGARITGSGAQAVSWSERNGAWSTAAPLDASPTLADEHVAAACSSGSRVVVVGSATRPGLPVAGSVAPSTTTTSTTAPGPTTTTLGPTGSGTGFDGQADDGTVAAAWSSSDGGASWTPATVSPQSGVGAVATMSGCSPGAGGWIAWGQAPAGTGPEVPALWTSADGRSWSLLAAPTLQVPGSSPLTGLATGPSSWVAVSGGPSPVVPAYDDPVVTDGEPALAASRGPGASEPGGDAGIWASSDRGATWSRLATTGPAWDAETGFTTDRVAFVGRDLVVAGTVDGALALWLGAPSAPSTAPPSSP